MRGHLSILAPACSCIALAAACGGSPTAPKTPACSAIAAPTSATMRVGDLFRFRFVLPSGVPSDVVLLTYVGKGPLA